MKLRPQEIDQCDDDAPRARKVAVRAALKELAAIYRQADALLVQVSCRCCGRCCSLARTRREPYLFPIELERLKLALAAAGRAMPQARPDGGCWLLDASGLRCSVYVDRPLGCRTFFCQHATGRSPDAEIRRLNARLTAVSDRLEPGAKPRQISELLAELIEFRPFSTRA